MSAKEAYILISDDVEVKMLTSAEAEALSNHGELLVKVDTGWVMNLPGDQSLQEFVAELFNEAHRLEFVR